MPEIEEAREVVFGSYADGAADPDGLCFIFYQRLWDIVKFDCLDMFEAWFEGNLYICGLSFAVITLFPKENYDRIMKNLVLLIYLIAVLLFFYKSCY